MNKKAPLFRLTVLLIGLGLLLTSCTGIKTLKITDIQIIEPAKADNQYHTTSENTETVAESAFVQLLFDKTTAAVSVKDKSNGFIWHTLPTEHNDFAYAFGVTLCTKNGIYHLNTQDNSVSFGMTDYDTDGRSIKVRYKLSHSGDQNDIDISFEVTYALSEQSLTVTVDTASIICREDSFVSELSVLPFFGSYTNSGEEDYILIPDGSGAIMHTNVSDAETDSISVAVYGADPFTENEELQAHGFFPVFGIKRGHNAFTAIITEGDALAEINANRRNNDRPAGAGATFTLTAIDVTEKNEITYSKPYSGKISVVYKFSSGKNANYTAMAAAAREAFIAYGHMSSSKKPSYASLPVFVTIAGRDTDVDLTNFNQTVDILSVLRGKGISNMTIRCTGFLSGGMAQKNLYTATPLSSLGGKKGLKTLHDYTSSQNNSLLLDVNIFSSSKRYTAANKAKTIKGDAMTTVMPNLLSFAESATNSLLSRVGQNVAEEGTAKRIPSLYNPHIPYTANLMRLSVLPEKFTSFLSGTITGLTDGYALNDAGRCLYSDSSTNRQEAETMMSELIRTIPTYGLLTVSGGNLYTVYATDVVTNMEFNTFYPESDAYEPVPFYQAVLHGYTLYTGIAVDAGDPLYKYNILRQIEYGAVPSFLFVNDSSSVFHYNIYMASDRVDEFTSFYNAAVDMLTPLMDKTIVGHEKIKKDADGKEITGVYRTSYSDGTDIYVNYSGYAVTTPQNIVVGAHSYVKAAK